MEQSQMNTRGNRIGPKNSETEGGPAEGKWYSDPPDPYTFDHPTSDKFEQCLISRIIAWQTEQERTAISVDTR
jgi:hypothetical protein